MDTKRGFDKVTSAVGLALISPVFATVSVVNAIHFGENPFHSVERIGQDGKTFNMLKFRSMRDAKDEDGNDLPDDDRITPWGKFLRATSLDELPQLVNVFKGDMSMVGPRPRPTHGFDDVPKEDAEKILSVRPGMTGVWQVAVIGSEKTDSENVLKNKLDAAYVEQQSGLLGDLALMAKTVPAFIRGHNGEYLKIRDSDHNSPDDLTV